MPDKQEHSELDQAMSELSRQTEALLSQSQPVEKSTKPVLPKPVRKVVPHRKGANLDIVNHKPSQVKVTVKHPQLHKEELLPEHAGISFNEKSQVAEEANPMPTPVQRISKSQRTKNVAAAAIIHPHEGHPRAGVESQQNQKSSEDDTIALKSTEHYTEHKKLEAQQINEEKKEEQKIDSSDDKAAESTSENTVAKSELSDLVTPTNDEPLAAEVEAPLATEIDDDNISEEDELEKPTPFDTTKYHPELHDWSKLAHARRWPIVILIILVMFAAALTYLYFVNQLPILQV